MRRIITIGLENESGALSRVAGLFSARGYNIESLTVAPTGDQSLSRMTIVTRGTDAIIEQIMKQLNKLIDVVDLRDLSAGHYLERELLLVSVTAETSQQREQIYRLIEIFRARILCVTDLTYILEMTNNSKTVDAFLEALSQIEIVEMVRSGVSGIRCI